MPTIKTYADPKTVAAAVAQDFAEWVDSLPTSQAKITVALSGGSTPKLLYELWADEYSNKIDWSRIHFFWGDERCVPADDDESNYGAAKKLFLDKIQISPANIHRVLGEADPDEERARYENEIYGDVEIDDNAIPQFDFILLGMGEDGHTASIFPHQIHFMKSDRVCEVAIHPETAQKRITLTGPVLCAARRVCVLVTGEKKASVLEEITKKEGDYRRFPIAQVDAADTVFFLDQAAAMQL